MFHHRGIPMPIRLHGRTLKEARYSHVHRKMEDLKKEGSLEKSSKDCWEFEEINLKSKAMPLGLGTKRFMASGTQGFYH